MVSAATVLWPLSSAASLPVSSLGEARSFLPRCLTNELNRVEIRRDALICLTWRKYQKRSSTPMIRATYVLFGSRGGVLVSLDLS